MEGDAHGLILYALSELTVIIILTKKTPARLSYILLTVKKSEAQINEIPFVIWAST